MWEPDVATAELPEAAWAQLARTELGGEDGQEETVTTDTPLLVNIKGCGYPPDTVCDTYYEAHKVEMVYMGVPYFQTENPLSPPLSTHNATTTATHPHHHHFSQGPEM